MLVVVRYLMRSKITSNTKRPGLSVRRFVRICSRTLHAKSDAKGSTFPDKLAIQKQNPRKELINAIFMVNLLADCKKCGMFLLANAYLFAKANLQGPFL